MPLKLIHFLRTSVILILSLLLMVACVDGPPVTQASDNNAMVMVVGATGKTGKEVVKHLLDQGYQVRVLVRNEEKAVSMFGDTVDVRVADITDAVAVSKETAGADLVISAIGSVAPSGQNSPEFVDYGGVKNLVDASIAAKVKQLVLISSMGATQVDHPLNKMFGNVLVWKLKGENYLRNSGLAYTIVRPGGLLDEPGRQAALQLSQGDTAEAGRISRDDVAEICVQALQNAGARNRTFEVVSSEGPASRIWSELFGGLAAD